MGIIESLENLEVSEKCFNSILDIVEGILLEDDERKVEPTHPAIPPYHPPKREPDYKPGKKSPDPDPDEFRRLIENPSEPKK